MRLLKYGVIYFALVFAAGFALGPIRILWLVPRVGERIAELIESPIMLAVIIVAARWVVRRLSPSATRFHYLAVGLVAVTLLLTCEFTVVLWLRDSSIPEYLANRDPIGGMAYLALLGLFAVMPLVLARR